MKLINQSICSSADTSYSIPSEVGVNVTISTFSTTRVKSSDQESELTLECTEIAPENIVPEGIIAPGGLIVMSIILVSPLASEPVEPCEEPEKEPIESNPRLHPDGEIISTS